jgi:hypothetical protein
VFTCIEWESDGTKEVSVHILDWLGWKGNIGLPEGHLGKRTEDEGVDCLSPNPFLPYHKKLDGLESPQACLRCQAKTRMRFAGLPVAYAGNA